MAGHLFLIGFTGIGKKEVGKELAVELGRRFVDMDLELEKRLHRSASESKGGSRENYKREETAFLRELADRNPLVVSTGEGLPEKDENWAWMRRLGATVFLRASFETCLNKMSGNKNSWTSWTDADAARQFYDRRRAFYERADYIQDVDDISPMKAAARISGGFVKDDCFTVSLDGVTSPVTATRRGPQILEPIVNGRRVFLLTDKKVARLHLDRYRPYLENVVEMILPGGERIKSLTTTKRIFDRLIEERFNRDDFLLAIGGGTVTDLGAFVAGTYKRGMEFLLVSTTLLGCVDAAVGGKAAINIGKSKNVMGCFTKPAAVILDALALSTLDKTRISEGLVEAYKTGLLADSELTGIIEKDTEALLAGEGTLMYEVARRSARIKSDVVSDDFTEKGRRAILNLGHTYGHAVEGWHNYKVSHGNAVALGLIVAAELSRLRGLISLETTERIRNAVKRISPGLPARPPLEEAWEIMLGDKKIRKGKLVFVLLEAIGQPVLVNDVTREELAKALDSLEPHLEN